MTSYELSRAWFDFSFENPELINPNHAAIFFFAIEHCNRLGWRGKFGFPTGMAMEAIGIKKHQTYIKYFNDLVQWEFFKLIQKSSNQYSANIISLQCGKPKKGKALDKAIITHAAKQPEHTGQSNSPIDKPDNKEPDNNKPIPDFHQFLEYAKTLKPYKSELNYSLEAKYNAWVVNGWKDGNNQKIQNWKTKLQNTILHLIPEKKEYNSPEMKVGKI